MTTSNISHSRRHFIKTASALSAMGAGTPFALNLAAIGAASAQTVPADYRALVCLFMFGGNDHTNTVIPYDAASYNEYSTARQGITIGRDALLNTTLGAVPSQGGREFALHPALPALRDLYTQKKLAVLANVGPLIVPTTKAQYQARSVPIPPKLFSHNDQQSVWQANQPLGEGARVGWGGRIGDLLASQNSTSVFTCISAAGNAVLLSGQNVLQYQVSNNGALSIAAVTGATLNGSATAPAAYRALLTRTDRSHLLEKELGRVTMRSIDANATLTTGLANSPAFTNPVVPANNGLANQLQVVARLIRARTELGTKRQVFFVSLGGFDHHDFLLDQQNLRFQTINAAVSTFWQWIAGIGLEQNVTMFTASDFGRTLTSNGDGSDHGWGSHHFVMGGAVKGGTIYGNFPAVTFGTSQDVGQGNLLPTTSVDQYAATLARWMGVSDTNLVQVLPNVGNFGTTPYLGMLG
jgi:uncharacterized protein (DUF1501 family)